MRCTLLVTMNSRGQIENLRFIDETPAQYRGPFARSSRLLSHDALPQPASGLVRFARHARSTLGDWQALANARTYRITYELPQCAQAIKTTKHPREPP